MMKDNEQNFDELKKLLKLKRHEVPPPGFFNNFSDKVVSRIRAGEVADRGTAFERLQSHSPWLARFISVFEAKSSIFGMSAAGLCLLLMVGMVALNEKSDQAGASVIAEAQTGAAPVGSLASLAGPTLLADGGGGIQISTNPASSLQPMATLFGQPNPLMQSAGFMPGQ